MAYEDDESAVLELENVMISSVVVAEAHGLTAAFADPAGQIWEIAQELNDT